MARGITESDVHTAADEIVGAGERPTVERIRAHLGTGSPNTVTRWLETWWQGLGQRLHAQQARLAVPAAPDAVAALAAEWWALALESARISADEDLAADRAALQDERDGLHRDREAFGSEAAVLRVQAETAAHAERVASTQAAELQRLVSRLEGQIEELSQQREAALARAVEAEAVRQAVEQRLQEHQEAAQAERESLANHVRTVEDRAHAEVDRARQEGKELKNQLAAVKKAHAEAEKSLGQRAEAATSKAMAAEREAGIQRARADALDDQLGKLRDLPVALEAALRRNEGPSKAKTARGKRPIRGSREPPKVPNVPAER